jgi:1,4-dihydroxy-2-naphthoate octaprenyltransferase
MLITAILTVNNLRDIEVDRKAGKLTLAVRFGKAFTRWEFAFLVFLGLSIPPYLYLHTGQHLRSLLSLLVVLPAVSAFRGVFGQAEGPSLNPVLANTARISLLYSVLFSVGWLL